MICKAYDKERPEQSDTDIKFLSKKKMKTIQKTLPTNPALNGSELSRPRTANNAAKKIIKFPTISSLIANHLLAIMLGK